MPNRVFSENFWCKDANVRGMFGLQIWVSPNGFGQGICVFWPRHLYDSAKAHIFGYIFFSKSLKQQTWCLDAFFQRYLKKICETCVLAKTLVWLGEGTYDCVYFVSVDYDSTTECTRKFPAYRVGWFVRSFVRSSRSLSLKIIFQDLGKIILKKTLKPKQDYFSRFLPKCFKKNHLLYGLVMGGRSRWASPRHVRPWAFLAS